MNRPDLYKKTVDIILDAYNNKTLEHGTPCGCFIGNIIFKTYFNNIAEPARSKISNWENNKQEVGFKFSPDWYEVLFQNEHGFALYSSCSVEEGLKQIASTGYTVEEITRMEKAFEANFSSKSQYKGMKAALEVLAEIHENDSSQSIVRLDEIEERIYA